MLGFASSSRDTEPSETTSVLQEPGTTAPRLEVPYYVRQNMIRRAGFPNDEEPVGAALRALDHLVKRQALAETAARVVVEDGSTTSGMGNTNGGGHRREVATGAILAALDEEALDDLASGLEKMMQNLMRAPATASTQQDQHESSVEASDTQQGDLRACESLRLLRRERSKQEDGAPPTCSVCLDDLSEDDVLLALRTCPHVFHKECLQRVCDHASADGRRGGASSDPPQILIRCPLCRRESRMLAPARHEDRVVAVGGSFPTLSSRGAFAGVSLCEALDPLLQRSCEGRILPSSRAVSVRCAGDLVGLFHQHQEEKEAIVRKRNEKTLREKEEARQEREKWDALRLPENNSFAAALALQGAANKKVKEEQERCDKSGGEETRDRAAREAHEARQRIRAEQDKKAKAEEKQKLLQQLENDRRERTAK